MTHSVSEEKTTESVAENDPLAAVRASDTRHSAPLPCKFRGVRAEDIMGMFADTIDHGFLETVLGCRGRKVPKDVRV